MKEKYNFVNWKGLHKHCVKSVQVRSFFWSVFSPNTGENGTKNTPYLDTFHAVKCSILFEEKYIKKRDIVCPFLLTENLFFECYIVEYYSLNITLRC